VAQANIRRVSRALCDLNSGDLSASPLAAILIEALRIRVTGELHIEANGGISRVYFRNGQPCGAEIFFRFKPLGQFLLEQGWIDIRALERSLVAVADGRKQGEALVALGFLTEEQLRTGLALHHLSHLRSLARLTEGTYTFTHREDLPSWTDEIRISAHRAILDALAMPTGAPVARRILRAGMKHPRLRLRPGWERYAGYFQFDEAEGLFVAKLSEPRPLAEILALSGLDLPQVYALSAALYLMGVLAPVEEGDPLSRTPVPEVTPGPATPTPRSLSSESTTTVAPDAKTPKLSREPGSFTPGSTGASGSEGGGTLGEPSVASPDEPTPTRPRTAGDATPVGERRLRMMRRAFQAIGGSPFARGPMQDSPRLKLPPGEPALFEKWVKETLELLPRLSPHGKLGLLEDATPEEVRRAYLLAAKRLHPDSIPPELDHLRADLRKIFAALSEAYETLRTGQRHLADERRWEKLRAEGLAALAECQWAEAHRAFEAALQIRDTPELRAHSLWAAYNDPDNREPQRQRRELEALYHAFPDCDAVCYYTGALARLDGDADLAERRFRAALASNPHHREARQELRLLEIRRMTMGPARK